MLDIPFPYCDCLTDKHCRALLHGSSKTCCVKKSEQLLLLVPGHVSLGQWCLSLPLNLHFQKHLITFVLTVKCNEGTDGSRFSFIHFSSVACGKHCLLKKFKNTSKHLNSHDFIPGWVLKDKQALRPKSLFWEPHTLSIFLLLWAGLDSRALFT